MRPKKLTNEQERILRERGTEAPFSGQYHDFKETGVYKCADCGATLFDSKTKFDSGTGWPSFYAPVAEKALIIKADDSLAESRLEAVCRHCGGHLGHVFPDGPEPTGKRYCINSLALAFEPEDKADLS